MMTLLAFLVTLALLIVVHEYGHYLAARLCGVKVLRFSVGFGQPLYSRRFGKDQTEFVIAAFPFGGYVKMLDERESPVPESEQSRSFNRQNVWRRSVIVAAGPAANLLLAILLYWILFMSGVYGMKPLLGNVPNNTPAAAASFKAGDLITRVDNQAVKSWQDVRWLLLKKVFKSNEVEIEAVNQPRNEFYLHRLDLSLLADNEFDGDVLKQLGLVPAKPAIPARVGKMTEEGAAQRDGLQPGDVIKRIDGIRVAGWEAFVQSIRTSAGKSLQFEVLRDGNVLRIPVTPDIKTEDGQSVGVIGASFDMRDDEMNKYLVKVKYSPMSAMTQSINKTWDISIFSLKMIGKMVTGQASLKGVSGPVTIASFAGQSAQAGWKSFIGFLALISISLGVLNLLPIPMLDGGHLMYYIVEILKGEPVSERMMEIGQRIGLAMIGLLMTLAIFNDINRIMS